MLIPASCCVVMMPLLQRLSKRVGCRIWDAIKAKLKEVQETEKVDKTLVDYVFVLFDPANNPAKLHEKLQDFLGDKTDAFVDWFAKVISQVDNQVTKASQEGESANKGSSSTENEKPTDSAKDQAGSGQLETILKSEERTELLRSGKQRETSAEKDMKSASRKIRTRKDSTDTSTSGSRRSRRKEISSEHHVKEDRSESHAGGASRMLSKAASDAVRSVQASPSSTSHQRKKDSSSAVIKQVDPSVEEDPQSSRNREPVRSPSKGETAVTREIDVQEENQHEESPPKTENVALKKRPHDQVAQKSSPLKQILTVTSALSENERVSQQKPQKNEPINQANATVGENETMEEDPDNMPGLLVVMPAPDTDHLNRIMIDGKLGYNIPSLGSLNRRLQNPHTASTMHMSRQRYPTDRHSHRPQFAPRNNNMGSPSMPIAPHFMNGPRVVRQTVMTQVENFVDEQATEEQEGFYEPPTKRIRSGPSVPLQPPADPSTVLCRYLPRCMKKAGVCPFLHPPCRNGKFCRYGATCVYDHTGRPTATSTPQNTGGANASVVHNVTGEKGDLSTKPELCRYHPYCTKPKCPYLHKQKLMCSFGGQCRLGAQRCGFIHAEDLALAKPDEEEVNVPDYEEESEMMDHEEEVASSHPSQ